MAIEVVEQFRIAHRLQGVQLPPGKQALYFFEQSRFHHLVYAAVDIAVQFFSVQFKTDFHDSKIARYFFPC